MEPSGDQQRESINREFLRLLTKHERQLSGYVHTLVPIWQDAEDILQNTKLRLWEQFDSYRRGEDFGAWAIAIANYMVRTQRKSQQRQRLHFSDKLIEKISQQLPTVSSSIQEDRAVALVECIKALNGSSRKLLRMFCEENRKIKDIALELGQTPAAAYTSLFRIRRSLFDCVQQRLREEQSR